MTCRDPEEMGAGGGEGSGAALTWDLGEPADSLDSGPAAAQELPRVDTVRTKGCGAPGPSDRETGVSVCIGESL